MKKFLFFALLLSGMATNAQTSLTNGNCKAQFKYEVNNKVMTLLPTIAINFYDKSEGKVKEWYWDFGEVNTSREQNPMFVFNHPTASPNVRINPYRTVSLTGLTTDTCKSSYSEMINIMDGSAYVKPGCKAGFKYYQTANDSISKTASFHLTNLSEGDSLKYLWQFNDGRTSNEKEPNITFDLKQSGLKVCLMVTGTNKCTDNFCDAVYTTIPINPNPFDPNNAECKTIFGYKVNYDIKTFAPALVLDFYSKASPDAKDWKWDFGDGLSDNKANPTHIFNFPLVKDSTNNLDSGNRKVCLTVKTGSGCIANYCEMIYVSDIKPDTSNVPKPELNYTMRYISSFPIQMSSCAGYVKALVYLKDSIINATGYNWSTGTQGQEVKTLCPTRTYTVKARTPDGIYVTGTFVFNSDGTVTELPINWWLTGKPENPIVQYDLNNKNFTVEWKLCDGTIIKGDSIPLTLINCGTKESNLILKDASGNVVYTENISQRSVISGINYEKSASPVKLFPNPVTDLLNIQYSGDQLNEMKIEIYDNSGKRVLLQNFYDVASGQQISLNVNSFRKGLYICKMLSGNRILGIEKFSK